jgi:Putative Actinobacterial Holin-X, holin superfamily III
MTARPDNELRDRPTGELLKELSDQTTTLVKQELELAKAELSEKGKQAGKGVGMFGGAGLFGIGAFAALTACLIALLATALDHVWISALVVAALYGAVAGVLAMTGKRKVAEAGPPIPEQARDSVKEDVQWAKTRTRSGMT